MSKTAIVPVQPFDEPWDELTREQLSFRAKWIAHVYARPAVPDELIEEAAKAIYYADNEYEDGAWEREKNCNARDRYVALARAAARVFNGGQDE